jgi:bisphosphoglycerate-dependent phosphoglycerate mutase
MEYGLPPPRRIKQRRDRKMAKKQVHTMATAEEVPPRSDRNFSVQQMVKYGCKETAECTLCKKAHEESGSSWNRELPKKTIGHIQSAGCLGQKEVVIAAHNACIRELLQEIDGHGKADRHIKLLTIETESRLGTLWDQEQ